MRTCMHEFTIRVTTTTVRIEHFADWPAVRGQSLWACGRTKLSRFISRRKLRVVAGSTWRQLHSVEMWDVSAPTEIMGSLHFAIFPIIQIYRHIFVALR